MYRNRNSVQIGLSIVESVCTLFFSVNYFSVGRLFPLPSALLNTGFKRWKVFGLNTLRRRQILPETTCRPTFQLSNTVCTTFADELRKRSIDGTEILIENWATFSKFVCEQNYSAVILLIEPIYDYFAFLISDLSITRPLAFLFSRFLAGTPSCLPLCRKVGITVCSPAMRFVIVRCLGIGAYAYGFVVGENLLIWWMEGVRCLCSKGCSLNIFSTNHSPKEKSTNEGRLCLNAPFGLLRFCWECILFIFSVFILRFNNSTKIKELLQGFSCVSLSWA